MVEVASQHLQLLVRVGVASRGEIELCNDTPDPFLLQVEAPSQLQCGVNEGFVVVRSRATVAIPVFESQEQHREVLKWFKRHERETSRTLANPVRVVQFRLSHGELEALDRQRVTVQDLTRRRERVTTNIPATFLFSKETRQSMQRVVDLVIKQKCREAFPLIIHAVKNGTSGLEQSQAQMHVALFIEENKPLILQNRRSIQEHRMLECTQMRWLAKACSSSGTILQRGAQFAGFRTVADLERKVEEAEGDDANDEFQPSQPDTSVSSAKTAIAEAMTKIDAARSEGNIAEQYYQYARAAVKLETAMEAARLGDRAMAAWCAVRLAQMYLLGEGVYIANEKSRQAAALQAMVYLEQARAWRSIDATYLMAAAMLELKVDASAEGFQEGKRLLQDAADKNHARACEHLGEILLYGIGEDDNSAFQNPARIRIIQQAARLFAKAAAGGCNSDRNNQMNEDLTQVANKTHELPPWRFVQAYQLKNFMRVQVAEAMVTWFAERSVRKIAEELRALPTEPKVLRLPPAGHAAFKSIAQRLLNRLRLDPSVVQSESGDTEKSDSTGKGFRGNTAAKMLLAAGIREELNREAFPGQDTWKLAEVDRLCSSMRATLKEVGLLCADVKLSDLHNLPGVLVARITKFCESVLNSEDETNCNQLTGQCVKSILSTMFNTGESVEEPQQQLLRAITGVVQEHETFSENIFSIIPAHQRTFDEQQRVADMTRLIGLEVQQINREARRDVAGDRDLILLTLQLMQEVGDDETKISKHVRSAMEVMRFANAHHRGDARAARTALDEQVGRMCSRCVSALMVPACVGYHNIANFLAIDMNVLMVHAEKHLQARINTSIDEFMLLGDVNDDWFARGPSGPSPQWLSASPNVSLMGLYNDAVEIVTVAAQENQRRAEALTLPCLHLPAFTFACPCAREIEVDFDVEFADIHEHVAVANGGVESADMFENAVTQELIDRIGLLRLSMEQHADALGSDSDCSPQDLNSVFNTINRPNLHPTIRLSLKMRLLHMLRQLSGSGASEDSVIAAAGIINGMKGRCPDGIGDFLDNWLFEHVLNRAVFRSAGELDESVVSETRMFSKGSRSSRHARDDAEQDERRRELLAHIKAFQLRVALLVLEHKTQFIDKHLSPFEMGRSPSNNAEQRTAARTLLNTMLRFPLSLPSRKFARVLYPRYAFVIFPPEDQPQVLQVQALMSRYLHGGQIVFRDDLVSVDEDGAVHREANVEMPVPFEGLSVTTVLKMFRESLIDRSLTEMPPVRVPPGLLAPPIRRYHIPEEVVMHVISVDRMLAPAWARFDSSHFTQQNIFFQIPPDSDSKQHVTLGRNILPYILTDAACVRLLEIAGFVTVPQAFYDTLTMNWAMPV